MSECQLCNATEQLSSFAVTNPLNPSADTEILLCSICQDEIQKIEPLDSKHWQCLLTAIWDETPAVQVLAWRLLKRMPAEPWAVNLLDQVYLADETLAWAQAQSENSSPSESMYVAQDSNANPLADGDSVTVIKDLQVKGANFTAKRGTIVKNISISTTPGQIEGRVNGVRIVLLTKFLKKL